jgi:hypothetical protein
VSQVVRRRTEHLHAVGALGWTGGIRAHVRCLGLFEFGLRHRADDRVCVLCVVESWRRARC